LSELYIGENQEIPNMALRYTTEAWTQDAAVVKVVHEMVFGDDNMYPEIQEIFNDTDKPTANAVLRLLEPAARIEAEARALQGTTVQTHSCRNAATWTNFMERFRRGPNHYSSPEPDRGFVRPSIERHNATPQPREHTPVRSEQRNPAIAPSFTNKLKQRDLEYDGTTPVTSYINRLSYMAQTYGEEAVLGLLPTAMQGNAKIWFDSIFPATRMQMNSSFDMWVNKLTNRFRVDPSKSLEKGDRMLHRFELTGNAEEDKHIVVDVREYLNLKGQAYLEAGEESEDLIVRRLHAGLDPTLKIAVHLNKYNSVDAFTSKVYAAEESARDQHESLVQRIKAASRPERRYNYNYNSYGNRIYNNRNYTETAIAEPPRALVPLDPQPMRYIPREAAKRITEEVVKAATAPVNRQLQAAPKRDRYPCTHCGSSDHIDPQCPQNPRNQLGATNKGNYTPRKVAQATAVGVQAYYTTDEMGPSDLVPVNEAMFQRYQGVYLANPENDIENGTPHSSGSPANDYSENELGCHSGLVSRP